MNEKDGGAAFPTHGTRDIMDDDAPGGWREIPVSSGGMTLRDYFAAQALASFAGDTRVVRVAINNQYVLGGNGEQATREARHCAEAAYVIADAMLKAREAK